MIKLKIYLLILFSQHITPQDKIESIYRLEYTIQESEISCAIIAFETQRLTCKDCAFITHKNLFGFMWKGKFIKYKSYSESIKDYTKWQKKRWLSYHKKYPNKSYYNFLENIYYCNDMYIYIWNLKSILKHG